MLDACVSNCGLTFHLEIASREFETEYRKLLHKTQEKAIRDKLLSCLEKWALNEFKSDPQLNLIPSMYNKLKQAGAEFPSSENDSPTKVSYYLLIIKKTLNFMTDFLILLGFLVSIE